MEILCFPKREWYCALCVCFFFVPLTSVSVKALKGHFSNDLLPNVFVSISWCIIFVFYRSTVQDAVVVMWNRTNLLLKWRYYIKYIKNMHMHLFCLKSIHSTRCLFCEYLTVCVICYTMILIRNSTCLKHGLQWKINNLYIGSELNKFLIE